MLVNVIAIAVMVYVGLAEARVIKVSDKMEEKVFSKVDKLLKKVGLL